MIFDGLIVGGGHNGLTLAAYLSRAGLRVAVLERGPIVGGGCSTVEPMLPGFRANLHSNFYISWMNAPLTRDLELYRFGFSTVLPPVQQGVASREGTALVIHTDVEKSCASMARFSKRDANTYRDLHELFAVKMQPLFASLMYNPPLAPNVLAQRLSGPEGRQFLDFAKYDLFSAVDRVFEHDHIRGLFKVLLHAGAGENAPGTGLALPHMLSALTTNALPVGGSLSLPLALVRIVEACGGAVVTNADVREITIDGKRVTGVKLEDGRSFASKMFVASGINLPSTMDLVGTEHFPETVRTKMAQWHWGHHSLITIHAALKEAPDYAAARFDPDMNRAFNVIFGFEDAGQIGRYFELCQQGKVPPAFMGNGACHSLFDPTYAPISKHVAFWYPFAPFAVEGDPEHWDRLRPEYEARLLEEWREYAPNIGGANVLASYVYTPSDIPRFNSNMVRGSIRMGAFVPTQLGINRPHPALADYRTPIEGLYLCASSSHGGGANGAPGYNAANVIAKDLSLRTPWQSMAPPEWVQ